MNSIYHNYSLIYSKYLKNFLDIDNICLAEIGILTGIGLAIWCDVFNKSEIYGFDIDINIFNKNKDNLIKKGAFKNNTPKIYNFDQYCDNKKLLSEINNKYNIVIDDGCHKDDAILKTFESFVPFLSDNFVYFIEDNNNVHKLLRNKYPKYNIYYENEMTVIKSI